MRQLFTFILLLFAFGANSQICVGESGQLQWKSFSDISEGNIGNMERLPKFPRSPDTIKTIYRLETPYNYKNEFGALIEGFISVPTSGNVIFNVTGDDQVRLYLSTDDQPANASLISFTNSATGTDNHNSHNDQTSQEIPLQTGEFYYFKLIMAEGGGSDYARVFWKNDFVADTSWYIITSEYLSDIGCVPDNCPKEGTLCDDGNPNTSDDQEDGNCHCVGRISTSNSCVGDRGEVFAYRYENITGSNINDLYQAINYPAMPDNGSALTFLTYPAGNDFNQIGNQVQGYLTVPESGEYKFNITGDDQTYFFLSTDEDPLNKENYSIHVPGWTSSDQYDKYPEQTGDYINLTKDVYYYYELNHKEGGGGENFSVQWKTPYSDTSYWAYIPTLLLYDYACELACISEGTPCDDGDKFTNNDQFDSACECIGTPCEVGDCDDAEANFVPSESCAKNMTVDNRDEDNWFSCMKTQNPNQALGLSHWIQYDLGDRYQLLGSTIWNYNGSEHPEYGFENANISVSEDGVNYTDIANTTFPLSDGTTPYAGFTGPNFNGTYARYVLITSTETDNACRGLGKIVFEAVLCPNLGSTCDDNDPNTILDQYNDICECKGVPLDANLCTEEFLTLGSQILATDNYSAKYYVTSTGVVAQGNKVSMNAGRYVELNTGFNSEEAQVFLANVAECLELPLTTGEADMKQSIKDALKVEDDLVKEKKLIVNEKHKNIVEIKYFLENTDSVAKLSIENSAGKTVAVLADYKHQSKSIYKKNINIERLQKGVYTVKFQETGGIYVDKIMVK